jgi:hypothetical protein
MVAFTTKNETFPEQLPVPVAVESGAPLFVDRLDEIQVQFSGTFTATIQLQGSLDNVNWTDVGAAVSAPGLVAVSGPLQFLRANVTAFTSGVPVAIVDGQGGGDQ